MRRSLADERGFTLYAALGVMLVTTMLSVAAFAAANGDITVSRVDQDRKQAFAAADAGMNDYAFHLADDPSYWSYCTTNPNTGAALPGVNQAWNGSGVDTRTQQRMVPGGSGAYYKLELIPANGNTSCNSASPSTTMIDSSTGTFRIRATGFYRAEKRSLVATFRRRSFLDYLYFTDLETLDPNFYYLGPTRTSATDPTTYEDWMGQTTHCQRYYRNIRTPSLQAPYTDPFWTGELWDPATSTWKGQSGGYCTDINFFGYDTVAGPLHTNDELTICNAPTFGRTVADRIESSAPAPGYHQSSTFGCTNAPNFVGTFTPNSPVLTLPPSNTGIKQLAAPAYRFVGRTTIVLNGATMTVTNTAAGLTNASMALPANGVVYVDNGVCSPTPHNKTTVYAQEPTTCGDAIVKGTYSQSLTIATKNDIVINGNLTHTGNALLGLIGDNFVRIYHPIASSTNDNATATAPAAEIPYGPFNNAPTIDAAILALNHSFTVDNYAAGAPMGNLTINGAIAQRWRGPVGTGGATITHGYVKAYTYDDRFAYLTPPHFIDPIQSAWRLVRESEQVPAR